MRAVEALIVLGAIGAVVFYGAWRTWRGFLGHRNREERAHRPWELNEHSDGEQVTVLAEKPDEEPLLIGAVPFAAGDFDARLYELRAGGREKVYALNEKD